MALDQGAVALATAALFVAIMALYVNLWVYQKGLCPQALKLRKGKADPTSTTHESSVTIESSVAVESSVLSTVSSSNTLRLPIHCS
jgi:hypothetical protein